MSAPNTADDLVVLVRKSGMIDEAKVTAFLQSHQRDGLLAGDARKVAVTMIRDGLITSFQAEQFLMGKWRGFTLGKFKLLERIGVGQMGQVFLCEHMFMRKRMAVKVLPPAKAEDPVSLGRFYREARVASGLEHQNIVRTFDIDQDGPLHFLVMEYVDGMTLMDIVKKQGPLSVVRAAHYMRMALVGLEYAHRQGMIHRDIKPGNIILDRNGIAKLLDMGLARLKQDDQDQITVKYDDKNILGSADYIAPEQTRDSRNIDIRADIYGMGASFYFVLTGRPPFPDGTVAEKIIAHQTKKPTPIREVRPEVPAGLAKIIDKMMAKNPEERYQTPGEVVNVLEVWTQEPIDPPTAAEMPALSPAAAVEVPYSSSPAIPKAGGSNAAVRDSSHVRPEEKSRSRSMSSSVLNLSDPSDAAFESGATVPVPRPATASASVVDLLLPFSPKPMPPAARLAPPLEPPDGPPVTPSRGALTDTPRPPSRPSSLPSWDVPKLPAELPKLSPSQVPLGSRPRPTEIPKPPSAVKPPSSLAVTPPPPAPPEPIKTFPSLRDALRGSSVPDMKKPPHDPLRKSSLPPPPAVPRDAPNMNLTETGPNPRWERPLAPPPPPEVPRRGHAESATPPVYRAPTLMPFFDQPVMPPRQPFFARVMRWLLMMAISSVIGALLGVAIWYQFLRH